MNSRRKFLIQSSALTASMFCSPLLFAGRQDVAPAGKGDEYFLIGDGERGGESLFGNQRYAPRPGHVRVWRDGQAGVDEIGLPFMPHSFVAHPHQPHRVITFEKWGMYLAEIDLRTREVMRITRTAAGRRFFGHGAHGGQYFYATQMDDQRGRGLVAVFDSSTHQMLHEIETRGVFPHDCLLLPDAITLLVVNSRRDHAQTAKENHSSVVWLDVASGACTRQVYIRTEEFGYAHMARSTDGYIVLAGSYDNLQGRSQPLLAVMAPNQAVRPLLSGVAGMRGEALSLYLDEANSRVVATLPIASTVQLWNYRSGALEVQYEIDQPRGLAFSSARNTLLVSTARTSGFAELVGGQLLLRTGVVGAGLGGGGSHLFRLVL
ncbi:MAG TPA: DUF1513 domain-containing protein [Gallionellaceae bacterium]